MAHTSLTPLWPTAWRLALAAVGALHLGCSDPVAQPRDGAVDGGADVADVADPLIEQSVVFEGRTGAYGLYRIPALIETPGGAVVAFAEGRQSIQDDGDIDLVARRSDDGGRSWSALQVVVDAGGDTVGNPAPVVDRDTGRLWLPFCRNPGAAAMQRSVWLTYSDDDGAHWAAPREITRDVKPDGWTWYATGPGRSIQLASGRIVVPCNHVDAQGVGRAHVIYSDDHGATWQRGGDASPDTDESQVAELSDGTLLLASRFEGPTFARAFSRSTDRGLHWSDARFENDLPDPHCQGSLLMTPGALWMSNPATRVAVPRDHLTVRESVDDGASWAHARLLDPNPSAYSALATLRDGRMAIVWESGRYLPYDRVRFAAFDRAWVRQPAP